MWGTERRPVSNQGLQQIRCNSETFGAEYASKNLRERLALKGLREKEAPMRKWYWPLAVLGLGGIGALLLTSTGRRGLRWVASNLHRAPDALAGWNENAQRELDRIQVALNRVAETLDAVR